MENLDQEFLAWLAGFWEGEGHFCVTSTDKRISNELCITQANKIPLELIRSKLGGHVYLKSRKQNDGRKRKPTWIWHACNRDRIIETAELILPFLKFRRSEVSRKLELVKEIRRTSPKRKWTEVEMDYIRENVNKLRDVDIARDLNRSLMSVHHARHKMGLFKGHDFKWKYKRWLEGRGGK